MLSALELARRGFFVVATMRNLEKRGMLDSLASEVNQNVEIRRLDVTDFTSIPEVVSGIVQQHGRIDVLVNNAGFAMGGFAEDVTLSELREQLETNFFGHVEMTKAVLPTMRRQHSGHVIMISSISGLCAQAGISSYSASKFALEGWSEALRIECKPLGIKVSLVEPGAFKTDIWDKNVRVAQNAMGGASPNRERAHRFRAYIQKHIVKRDAIEVARLVTKIAQHPDPKLRYVIGGDAHFQLWLRRMLPWKWYENALIKALGLHDDKKEGTAAGA